MSEATEQFVAVSGPFKAHHRWPNSKFSAWSVRDKHGYEVCLCDDDDSAHAIAEVLNEAKAGRKQFGTQELRRKL